MSDELPEPFRYPVGDVVGACACGSWPGGSCLKCPPVNFCTADKLKAAVLQERERAEQDAKRYRWLQFHLGVSAGLPPDAAIDAAIRKGE